jgi:hypothetical protein
MTNDDLQVDVAAELSRDPKVDSRAKYAAMSVTTTSYEAVTQAQRRCDA